MTNRHPNIDRGM